MELVSSCLFCSCLKASTIGICFITILTLRTLVQILQKLDKAWKIRLAEITGDIPYPPVPIAGSETERNSFESASRRHFSRHVWRCLISDDSGIKWIMWRTFKSPPLVTTTEPPFCGAICLHSCFTFEPQTCEIALLTSPALSISISGFIMLTMASDSSSVRSPWMTSMISCSILALRLHPLSTVTGTKCFSFASSNAEIKLTWLITILTSGHCV